MVLDARAFLRGLYLPDRLAATESRVTTASATWAKRAAALLALVRDDDSRVSLRERFEERAAICEYDGGVTREDAERVAFEEIRAVLETNRANIRHDSRSPP